MSTQIADQDDFESDGVRQLRDDLALALRAAAYHGLSEGVCNHFSVELPDRAGRFLLNLAACSGERSRQTTSS